MFKTETFVKEGYEDFHAEVVGKLERVEQEALEKVEQMIAEDKRILNNILAEITYTKEIEVPDEIAEPVALDAENAEVEPANFQ